MKRKVTSLLMILVSILAFSQVGINTTSPKATLDVVGQPTDATKKDGILIPRLTGNQLKAKTYGTDQKSALVYVTAAATTPFDNGTSNVTAEGFYYFTGTAWTKLNSGGSDGDAWGVNNEDKTSAVNRTGNVAIGGTTNANAYAKLQVSSTNQGILIPNINLTSTTLDLNADSDNDVTNQPTGLMVFNSGSALPQGYYYWSGTEWTAVGFRKTKAASIGDLYCIDAYATPGTFTSGTAYTGTLTIPYIGGNGGAYAAQTMTSGGLTATLAAGNLNNGAGDLIYELTGTPTFSSPSTTTFSVNIGGITCDVKVGAPKATIGRGETLYYTAEVPATPTGWLSDLCTTAGLPLPPVIGNKIRMDIYFAQNNSSVGGGNFLTYPRIVNISTNDVKLWFAAMTTVDRYNATNYLLGANKYVDIDNGIYFNFGFNDTTSSNSRGGIYSGTGAQTGVSAAAANHTEFVILDILVDGFLYQVHIMPFVDNKNTTGSGNGADDTRKVYMTIERLY